jgi:hypothetical protein
MKCEIRNLNRDEEIVNWIVEKHENDYAVQKGK